MPGPKDHHGGGAHHGPHGGPPPAPHHHKPPHRHRRGCLFSFIVMVSVGTILLSKIVYMFM